jgi:hypothetical protein
MAASRRRRDIVGRAQAQRLAERALGPAHPAALRRWRRLQAAHRHRKVAALTREFVAWHGLQVSGGPFAGLVYPDTEATSLIPKLLGVYERELHEAIEAVIGTAPQLIVNVGAADGYYAVGLARRCPAAVVHAFEADPAQRALLARVAEANGVELQIGGAAQPGDLPRDRALVVIDCEGCEEALLQPELLRAAMIVAELHDFLVPGDPIVARFQATHEIRLVPTGAQPPRGDAVALALDEYRPGPMRWAVMTPR